MKIFHCVILANFPQNLLTVNTVDYKYYPDVYTFMYYTGYNYTFAMLSYIAIH